MRRKFWIRALAAGMIPFVLTACGSEEERDNRVELVQEESKETYPVAAAEYGEVAREVTISCGYTSVREEEFSFPLGNRLIERVDVEIGDFVTKGQVLASLDVSDLEDLIAEKQDEITLLELQKKQTEELLAFDLSSAETLYFYTKMTQKDQKDLEKKQEDIRRQYKTPLEDLEDSLTLARHNLEQAKKELEGGRLVTELSGQVTYCKTSLQDSYSVEGETVMIVSDQEYCYFVSSETEWADCFAQGEIVELEYRTPGKVFTCEAEPVQMDEWGERMYFKPVGDDFIELGASGKITMELDRKEHVLRIPAEAVHESDQGDFVYLVQDGLLEMCYVKVGLEGDAFVEILEGLKEGDTVALQR